MRIQQNIYGYSETFKKSNNFKESINNPTDPINILSFLQIMAAELRHVLMALGERLSADEADEIMKGAEDAEGMVNYEGNQSY